MSGLLDLLAQPWAVWGAFALAQIADVWTTDRVLRGGGRELNPVVATLMGKLGRGWIAGKLAIAGGAAWYLVEAGHPGLVWAVTAVTGAVAANNARFIR